MSSGHGGAALKAQIEKARNSWNRIARGITTMGKNLEIPEPKTIEPLAKSFIQLDSDPTPSSKIDDKLFSEYIPRLRQLISSAKPPFVFAINGEWGRGKTFIVEHALENDNFRVDAQIVKINAWDFPADEPTLPYFLSELCNKLGTKPGDSEKLLASAAAVSWLVTAVPPAAKFRLAVGAATAAMEWAVRRIKTRPKNLEALRTDFLYVVSAVLKKNKKSRLIVFLDNLDRCSPEKCLQFLEHIANFLKTEQCIFIIALDQRIIESEIRRRYGASSHITAGNFLEKIIDLSLTIPAPSPANIATLIGDRFSQLTDSADLRAAMRNATSQFSNTSTLMGAEMASNPRKWFRLLKHIAADLHFRGFAEPHTLFSPICLMSAIRIFKPDYFEGILKSSNIVRTVILISRSPKAFNNNGLNLGNFNSGQAREARDNFVSDFAAIRILDDPDCANLSIALAEEFSNRKTEFTATFGNEFPVAMERLALHVSKMMI